MTIMPVHSIVLQRALIRFLRGMLTAWENWIEDVEADALTATLKDARRGLAGSGGCPYTAR